MIATKAVRQGGLGFFADNTTDAIIFKIKLKMSLWY